MHQFRPITAAALLAGLCLAVTPAICQVRYDCYRAIGPIVADGRLNESSWQHAAASGNFVIWDDSGPGSQATTVKLVWDDAAVYVGYQVQDTDMYATYTGRDSRTWEQDVVELFSRVPGDPTAYVEYEISPLGTIWDGTYTDIFTGPAAAWDSPGFAAGVQVDGTVSDPGDTDVGFTAEMAIPWPDIYKNANIPTDGAEIWMNFNRIDWQTPDVLGGRGKAGTDEYTGWSPTIGPHLSFHRPDEFGIVAFRTAPVPEPAALTLLAAGGLALLRRRDRHRG